MVRGTGNSQTESRSVRGGGGGEEIIKEALKPKKRAELP